MHKIHNDVEDEKNLKNKRERESMFIWTKVG